MRLCGRTLVSKERYCSVVDFTNMTPKYFEEMKCTIKNNVLVAREENRISENRERSNWCVHKGIILFWVQSVPLSSN